MRNELAAVMEWMAPSRIESKLLGMEMFQEKSSPAVSTRALRFSYGAEPVFNTLDMNVPKGSIYGLLGPNGCGKSTLFRLLLGQSEPGTGQVHIMGVDATQDYVTARFLVGYVPQENDLPSASSIEEVLDKFRQVYAEQWNQALADRLLQRFGLAGRLKTEVQELSRGLQQRLTLVTAIACEPEVLLLDEPTAGLDAVVRRQFTETVIDYMAAKEGRTVVISSHLLSELEPLVDHVGFLVPEEPEGSRMLVESSLQDLKDKIRIAELGRQEIPALELEGHHSLLCRADDDRGTLVFWIDAAHEDRDLEEKVTRHGGHLVDQAGLSDVFVRLFRGEDLRYFGRVVDGRRVHACQQGEPL